MKLNKYSLYVGSLVYNTCMKRGLYFLLASDAWANLALGMLGPIYAIFVEQIGGDILDASWAYFAFTFTSGIMIYIVGRWEDYIPRVWLPPYESVHNL